MVHVAVVLSGCGHLDGAEIRESILTLLALDQLDATVTCFAPNINQTHTINHLTGEETSSTRNVLEEAARITRGDIHNLNDASMSAFDALIIPGGFGVAKNLSDLAFKGTDCTILPAFTSIINDCIAQKKPLGAICIAPAVLVAAIQHNISATVTIGDDNDGLIASLGGQHTARNADDIAIDDTHNIISCSAYMREDRLKDIASGIHKLVNEVIKRCA